LVEIEADIGQQLNGLCLNYTPSLKVC